MVKIDFMNLVGTGDLGGQSHRAIVVFKNLVRTMFDPGGRGGVRGPAIGAVVLESPIFGWVVRRRDDDAVGVAVLTSGVVFENRMREHRSRRGSSIALDLHVDIISQQHFERGFVGSLGECVGVHRHEQGAIDVPGAPKITDRLRDRENVRPGERRLSRCAPMAARPEDHSLSCNSAIGSLRFIGMQQLGDVNQHFNGGRASGEFMNGHGGYACPEC